MKSHSAAQESRLHIRTSPLQKALLARAAEAKHLNLSQFVLQSSLEVAEKIVGEATKIPLVEVSDIDYDWLIQKMDEPPRDLAELRGLLNEPTVWNG